jgi:hypothetical protein
MEIDHAFIFAPKRGKEGDALVTYDLIEGPVNAHSTEYYHSPFINKNCN